MTIRAIFIISQTARTAHMVVQLRMSHMSILSWISCVSCSPLTLLGCHEWPSLRTDLYSSLSLTSGLQHYEVWLARVLGMV